MAELTPTLAAITEEAIKEKYRKRGNRSFGKFALGLILVAASESQIARQFLSNPYEELPVVQTYTTLQQHINQIQSYQNSLAFSQPPFIPEVQTSADTFTASLTSYRSSLEEQAKAIEHDPGFIQYLVQKSTANRNHLIYLGAFALTFAGALFLGNYFHSKIERAKKAELDALLNRKL